VISKHTVKRFIWALVLLAPAPVCLAQDVPPGAIAYWSFDPTHFSPNEPDPRRALVEGTIRAALAGGLIEGEDAARIIAGLLEAEPGQEEGEGTRLTNIQAVLEIHTADDHRAFVRTIRSFAVDAERAAEGGDGAQRPLDLPGGRTGVAYTEDDWPAWREVSWCSSPGVFYVGLGRGALERWLEPGDEASTPWIAHRESVAARRDLGEVFFEVFVDIDAFRTGYPEAFGDGRAYGLLRAWNLINARAFMLQARWIEPGDVELRGSEVPYAGPPIIAFDASWSARSRVPGTIVSEPVSAAYWPGDELRMEPPPGSYAIVTRADWAGWVNQTLDTFGSSRKEWDAIKFDALRSKWQRNNKETLDGVASKLGPWVVFSDAPRPVIALPGLTTMFAELGGPMEPGFQDELADVLATVLDNVAFDDETRVWSASLLPPEIDPGGLLRVIAWGIGGPPDKPVLVMGWGANSVRQNLERLEPGNDD